MALFGIFGKSVKKDAWRGAKIVVNIGNDDPNRGDSQAYKGIGQIMAQKLGGSYVYLSGPMLDEMYPNIPKPSDRTAAYFEEHGNPDVYLSNCSTYAPYGLFAEHNVYSESGMNISISQFVSKKGNDMGIVSHNITEDMLKEEGKKFDKAYPQTKGRHVIGVHLIHNLTFLQEKLIGLASHHEKPCIFICGTRRTNEYALPELKKGLKKDAEKYGIDLEIIVYDFKKNRENDRSQPTGYNPYVGLISRADISVADRGSQSIVTECLVKGQSILTIGRYREGFYEEGYGENIEKLDVSKEFKPKKIQIPNMTEQVADVYIRRYKKHITEQRGIGSFFRRKLA